MKWVWVGGGQGGMLLVFWGGGHALVLREGEGEGGGKGMWQLEHRGREREEGWGGSR